MNFETSVTCVIDPRLDSETGNGITVGYYFIPKSSSPNQEAENNKNTTSTSHETGAELNKQESELEKEEALLQQTTSEDTANCSLSDSAIAEQKVHNTTSSPETLVHEVQHNKCIQNNQVSY